MTIFQPDADPVVIREHFYYDTGVRSLVLSDNKGNFVPVEQQGLGIFNYLFSNAKSVTGDGASVYEDDGKADKILAAKILLAVAFFVTVIRYGTILRAFNKIFSRKGASSISANSLICVEPPTRKALPDATYFRKFKVPKSKRRATSGRVNRKVFSVGNKSSKISASSASSAHASQSEKIAIPYQPFFVSHSQQTVQNNGDGLSFTKLSKGTSAKIPFRSLSKLETENSQYRFNPTFNLESYRESLANDFSNSSENPFNYDFNATINRSCNTPEASSVSSADTIFSPYRSGNSADDQVSPILEQDPMYIKLSNEIV